MPDIRYTPSMCVTFTYSVIALHAWFGSIALSCEDFVHIGVACSAVVEQGPRLSSAFVPHLESDNIFSRLFCVATFILIVCQYIYIYVIITCSLYLNVLCRVRPKNLG